MPDNSQALAHRSIVAHDLEKVSKILLAIRERAHILTPFCRTNIPHIPDGWDVYFHQYKISTQSVTKNGRVEFPDDEVYPVEGKLALTKIGLWRLEQLAGVNWENPKTGRSSVVRVDDGKDSLVCRYQATGYIRDLDGQIRSQSDGFGYDLRDNSPQHLALQDKPKALAQLRKNIEQQTITKAKLRVLRSLLGIKSSYRPHELEKPFVVLKMTFNIDTLDPEVKKNLAMIQAAKQMGIEKELFGFLNSQSEETIVEETIPEQLSPVVEPLTLPAISDPITGEVLSEDADLEADREYWEERGEKIEAIKKLYQSKKGKTREELSPTKPLLEELSDDELTGVQEALSKLPNLK